MKKSGFIEHHNLWTEAQKEVSVLKQALCYRNVKKILFSIFAEVLLVYQFLPETFAPLESSISLTYYGCS
ncbi:MULTISPECIES: hypothetical protein [Nostocales]|uniref:Transposase n=2 Tax=Nostocales TaxID=1161 RepID=A0ABW8WEY1_9CYAN